ncbi:uncharacterized protein LOC110977870 [Acanthaster planci]|uniref:Soluble interferon alpha/beta receptor OPG204 n=1 Tax=Acanthaster planci TaxID=133434 RepID=A0A8B7Y6W4_ACAPL|nr:uncharacterized protein LOC110977870 [Acanthaster planci]XP_022088075.1 uncharacterized protein LOC110977870 [Acanthaster planci]
MAVTRIRRLVTLTTLVTALATVLVTPPVRGFAVCQQHSQTDKRRLHFDGGDFKVVGYQQERTEVNCGAHDFCNVSWTKGGQPVRTTDNIQLIDRNQKLQFKELSYGDGGVYVCEASDGRTSIRRTFTLYVTCRDCISKFEPINLHHQRCLNASANIGGVVTFTCEFHIGSLDCPSVSGSPNFGSWLKVNKSAAEDDLLHRYLRLNEIPGSTAFNVTEYRLEKLVENGAVCNYSDCRYIFGFKLEVKNISENAFGTYKLSVHNCGWQKATDVELMYAPPTHQPEVLPEDWHHHLTIPLVCLVVITGILLLAWHRVNTDVKLKWKDFAGKRDDSKSYDVYLSYDWSSEQDQSFAISLARRLGELGYKVLWEIHCLPGGDTDEDILQMLETSCRCVIIFSPDYLSSRRNLDVIFAMDNAKNYKREIIPVVYRDISGVAGEEQSALVRQILSLPCLRYDRIPSPPLGKVQKVVRSLMHSPYSEKSLHKELLLRLPPRRQARPPSHGASDLDLISAEVPQHVSSRESVSQYPSPPTCEPPPSTAISNGQLFPVCEEPNAGVPPGPVGSKLYPDITGLTNMELIPF